MVPLIDRYIRHGLMRSESKADHALAEKAKKQLMLYGIQVTQTGTRRVLHPSRGCWPTAKASASPSSTSSRRRCKRLATASERSSSRILSARRRRPW